MHNIIEFQAWADSNVNFPYHETGPLRIIMIHSPHLDLVNINVYRKFRLILSIFSEDIEQKPNSDIYQGL